MWRDIMKQKLIIIISLTGILIYFLFPKTENEILVHEGVPEIESFEIILNGAIAFPGVYTYYSDISLNQAISFAGGFLSNADYSALNMNQLLSKNKEIFIPFVDNQDVIKEEKININQASFKELLDIPYMTESRAASLIIYRETHGDFQSVDDLIFVKYIGEVTLENLRPYVKIS